MEHEILHKLRAHLSEPFQKERDVVYLLVEIRKLLTHIFPARDDEIIEFPVLRMYCDWVVHTELSGAAKDNILMGLDKVIKAPGNEKIHFDVLAFHLLHRDLCKFLVQLDLPKMLETDYAQCGLFLRFYINIVSECPLKFGAKIQNLKSATPILLQLPNDPDLKNCIAMNWKLVFRDGTTQNRSMTFSF